MPRYDIKCNTCHCETIFYFQAECRVEAHDIPCEHCGSEKTELIAFYEDEQSQIMALQKEIDNLIDVVDGIMEKMGYNEDTEPDPEKTRLIH